MRLKTTDIDSLNGATRSEYVFSFLVAAASLFKNDIIIRPQKQLKGRYGKGPVDFALETKASGGFLGVTQVSREDFRSGIAQNVVQLELSLSNRIRKHTEIADTSAPSAAEVSRVFGLVTDASVWYILECVMDSNEGISVKMAKVVPVIVYKQEGWENIVEGVFSRLVWLLQRIQVDDSEDEERANKRLRLDMRVGQALARDD